MPEYVQNSKLYGLTEFFSISFPVFPGGCFAAGRFFFFAIDQ